MDFVILKVNGTDVSNFPHEDAVQTFLTAEEPIVVEVKRRIAAVSHPISSALVSTGVQTEDVIEEMLWTSDDAALDCFTHDIDLEEVTLRKWSSSEKLGLTVCYSSGSEADTCTEVYIRDIAPQSVADRDGRLRQGDQILQVNGKDVANREETESLFAENRKAVTLLVSRCYNRSEEELVVEAARSRDVSPAACRSAAYQNSIIEQLVVQQQQLQHGEEPEGQTTQDHSPPHVPPHHFVVCQDKLNLTNSLVRTKLDSINHEICELNQRMQNIQLVKLDKRRQAPQLPHVPAPLDSDSEHIYETIPESLDSELEPIYCCPYEAGDENVVEQWLKIQQQANGDWTSNALLKDGKDGKDKSSMHSKSSKSTSSGEEHENSSSAYNTGGSSNSNPLTFELAACNMQDAKHRSLHGSSLILCPPVSDITEGSGAKKAAGNATSKSSKQRSSKIANTQKACSPSSPTSKPIAPPHMLSDTMYTNVANLQQTILLQQEMFRKALGHSAGVTAGLDGKSTNSACVASSHMSNTAATMDTAMEWKVKRRADGTRYIARRPVRNRILRSRELKISEERCGLTTEDDTISELKVGRYWSKEERKKHIEKSRERKQRQEILLASRNLDAEEVLVTRSNATCPLSKKAVNNMDNTVKKHKSKQRATQQQQQQQQQQQHQKDNYENYVGMSVSQNSNMMGLLSVTTV